MEELARKAFYLRINPRFCRIAAMCASTSGACMRRIKARLVTAFLESFFARYVGTISPPRWRRSSTGCRTRKSTGVTLRDFWKGFTGALDDIKDIRIGEVLTALDAMLAPHVFPARADGADPRICQTCGTGHLSIKLGKFGAFIGCSNYPECRFTRPFAVSADSGDEIGTKVLGQDPDTGLDVTVRSGRFGPYIQLGETVAKGEKPKRASIPKGQSPADIELQQALALLSLPREVGRHPESGDRSWPGSGDSPLCPARQDLRDAGGRRRRPGARSQSRRDLDCRKGRQGPGPRPWRGSGPHLGEHPEKKASWS